MRRRAYVTAATSLVTVATAGCLGLFGGGEQTEAEVATEEYLAAIRENDWLAVNEKIAENGEADRWSRSELQSLSAFEPRVTSFEVVEQSEESVVADVTVQVQAASTTAQETVRYEFRPVDGEWKVWRVVEGGLR